MHVDKDVFKKLGLRQEYEHLPDEWGNCLLKRDKAIVERYYKGLQRPSGKSARKCSRCGVSTRKERVCDTCFAWEKVFIKWYREDPVGKRIYNLINETQYQEQVTEDTFSDYVELGEMLRLYDNKHEPLDIAHLFPKRPRSGGRVGLHTKRNLVIVPSCINRKMGNYIFSEELGESVCVKGKRRILKKQWPTISKKFKFIDKFKNIDWFEQKRELETLDEDYKIASLLTEQAKRFSLKLSESLSVEEKWLRLLRHCLDSKDVEISSMSGFHDALVGFGTEYPSKLYFHLKGLCEKFYKKWCVTRNYDPNDELVLQAVEWFIHWQADDVENGIWDQYQHYKNRESYDPSGFPFLMEVYSSSIRLIMKVIREYPLHNMDLRYAPKKGRWTFPKGIRLNAQEAEEEVRLIKECFYRYRYHFYGIDVDEEMIRMQISFLGDGGSPARIFPNINGKYCEYPIEEI